MTVELETRRMFEEVLGCKWTLAILGALRAGVSRPGRLRRSLTGLSSKVLQDRLRKLERFGLVRRLLVAEKPLHVEYRLTPKGRELGRIVLRLRSFESRWSAAEPLPAQPTQRTSATRLAATARPATLTREK